MTNSIVLLTRVNFYGEKINTSFIEKRDGKLFLEEMHCYSSKDYGMGTCNCCSHDTWEEPKEISLLEAIKKIYVSEFRSLDNFTKTFENDFLISFKSDIRYLDVIKPYGKKNHNKSFIKCRGNYTRGFSAEEIEEQKNAEYEMLNKMEQLLAL